MNDLLKMVQSESKDEEIKALIEILTSLELSSDDLKKNLITSGLFWEEKKENDQ